MPKPEDILKAQVIAYLNRAGIFYLRLNSGKVAVKRGWMSLCPLGTSDFLVCCPDPRWIELKAPGQKTAKARKVAQDEFRDRVQALGHVHSYVTSLDELEDALRPRTRYDALYEHKGYHNPLPRPHVVAEEVL